MNTPRVSVVMAAYNAREGVRAAVESIVGQSFTDWELVVVDDGSRDETPAILRGLAATDPRIRVLTHQRNAGLPASLNDGIAAAQGALIARMDADDRAVPHRLARQVAFMDLHPEVHILGGGALQVCDDGRVLPPLEPPERHEDLSARIYFENPLIHPTVIARREVFEQLGGYATTLRRGQDYDLWLRAHRRFRMWNLQEPLIWYQRRGKPRWRDTWYSIRVVLRALRRDGRLWQAPWVAGRPLAAALAARVLPLLHLRSHA